MSDDKELLDLLEYKDDKIRKLQKESTKLRNDCKMFQERYHGSLETQKELEEENKNLYVKYMKILEENLLLIECAEFYADYENKIPFDEYGDIKARQTLAKIKG